MLPSIGHLRHLDFSSTSHLDFSSTATNIGPNGSTFLCLKFCTTKNVHLLLLLLSPASAASPPPLVKRFIFIFICEYMPHECRVCAGQKRVSDSPAARVTGSGELPHMGA